MKTRQLTATQEQNIATFGECIFSEARLFPYKKSLIYRVPISTLEKKHISFAEAKNLISAINYYVGTPESHITILNSSLIVWEKTVGTMIFGETFTPLENILIDDERDYLILSIDKFLDLEKRFKEYFFDASNAVARFDEIKSMIVFGNKEISLPPTKDEFDICKAMFSYKIHEPKDWSLVWNKIDGSEGIPEKKLKKKLRDTTDRLNKRIEKELGFRKNLFTWKGKTISRNF